MAEKNFLEERTTAERLDPPLEKKHDSMLKLVPDRLWTKLMNQ